ncbi:ExbD/TolR family protein [Oleisolibacter albus]|uniref:ExbD/TolR family protein n=1 Tax=Oleisolibacter albus TaxID=2171757 RepID=UPI000DF45FF7|nr:biopolymer transporter ExbD [Oleisolibacter albus]
MNVQGKGKRYDEINITPMLDLAFVLLVIFIIMTTASVQGIKVDLPKASTAAQIESQTKAITINDAGDIFYEAVPVTLEVLEQRLRVQQALTPEFPVVVKGSGGVPYYRVVEVLDLLRKLELTKVGLATGKLQPPPAGS